MTDTMATALISVGGMFAVALLGATVQVSIAKQLIGSEFRKIAEQLVREAGYRRTETKAERVADAVSQLLAISDPEANANIVYRDVVALIHRIQLQCDPTLSPEKDLRGALNELGLALKVYLKQTDRFDETGGAIYGSLLEIHGRIAESARQIVAFGQKRPELPVPAV
jgi:hypothetical protein